MALRIGFLKIGMIKSARYPDSVQERTSKRKANHSKFKQARHCWHVG
jgi:hypothetical protein